MIDSKGNKNDEKTKDEKEYQHSKAGSSSLVSGSSSQSSLFTQQTIKSPDEHTSSKPDMVPAIIPLRSNLPNDKFAQKKMSSSESTSSGISLSPLSLDTDPNRASASKAAKDAKKDGKIKHLKESILTSFRRSSTDSSSYDGASSDGNVSDVNSNYSIEPGQVSRRPDLPPKIPHC